MRCTQKKYKEIKQDDDVIVPVGLLQLSVGNRTQYLELESSCGPSEGKADPEGPVWDS